MGRVEGKVCVVTGGALGLGRADVEALAREGGRVVITDVNADAGRAAAEEIGSGTVFVEHDVRDEEAWKQLVGYCVRDFGGLHVLVNNAGVIKIEDIETATLENWRFVQSVNVEGTFLGVKHSIPAMRASGSGSIINVSSTAAILGMPDGPAYTASKGAVQALTRAIAVHCMRKGDPIRCNAIYPHLAESPMSMGANMGVALFPAAGVGNAVLFLASDESSDLNGTFLNLDHGTACLVGEVPRG